MIGMILIVGGIISFIIGSLIFLIGIGAIAGIAGGMFLVFGGVFISLAGIGAIIQYVLSFTEDRKFNVEDIIDLFERGGRWAT